MKLIARVAAKLKGVSLEVVEATLAAYPERADECWVWAGGKRKYLRDDEIAEIEAQIYNEMIQP